MQLSERWEYFTDNYRNNIEKFQLVAIDTRPNSNDEIHNRLIDHTLLPKYQTEYGELKQQPIVNFFHVSKQFNNVFWAYNSHPGSGNE